DYLIVGLGNPEKKYEQTRHNIGFAAVDLLAQQLKVASDRLRFQALCGDASLEGHRVLLMKPTTYMNLSGQAVQEAMRFYKLPIERVIVLCDDVALEVGRLRIRERGSDGGHNGLKNIIALTGSNEFTRIRIGVGQKPHPDYDLADWVLGKFSTQDRAVLLPLLQDILPACALLVQGQTQLAMTRFNK
ncbi:MAG: aminoacyl-tRNA hydrolase, partial [Angelakisella sp.]